MITASLIKRYSLRLIFIYILTFCCQQVFAQKESYTQKLNGFLKAGDSCVVVDDKYAMFDNKAWGKIKHIKVEDLISLQLRFDTLGKIPNRPFKAELLVDIYYWNADRSQEKPTEKKNVSLRIEYDTAKGKAFKSFDAYAFKDAYKVAVVIRKIKGDLFKDSLPPFFQLNNEINIVRKYEFDPTIPLNIHTQIESERSQSGLAAKQNMSRLTNLENSNTSSLLAISNCESPAYILNLSWSPESNADEYDLEYCFIDHKSEYGTFLSITTPTALTDAQIEQMFLNNSTRVTIKSNADGSNTNYKVNLAYDQGYFLYRIRTANNHIPNPAEPEFTIRDEGSWVYATSPSTGSIRYIQYIADGGTTDVIKAHESCLNWQYNASFAEDAKRKEILTYFDGKLQNRQTVTINNVDNIAVVQETILDEFGRAAASILPAPVNNTSTDADPLQHPNNNKFQYYRNFNLNNAGNPYSYTDLLYGNNCNIIAAPLANVNPSQIVTGAAGYYSEKNLFKVQIDPQSGDRKFPEQDYVADASNYPLSVTEYTPDQTGRIKRQGGVGPTFQIGQKDTKYFYGKPNQYELDRLFGSEAGNASRYLKNMVMDPNGQISVSYINSSGKTVATALAGAVTPNLDALASYPETPATVQTKLLKPSDFNFDVSSGILLGTSTFLAPVTGDYALTYALENLQHVVYYNTNLSEKLCYTCYYDVEISVRNNCNKTLLTAGANIQNGVLVLPVGIINKNCVDGPQQLLNGTLHAVVGQEDLGECYVSYTLKLSKKAEDYYVNEHWKDNTDLLRFQSFLLKYFDVAAFADCYTDCDACKELGDKKHFVSELQPYIVDLVESKKDVDIVVDEKSIEQYLGNLYDQLKAKCDNILNADQCHGGPCEEKLSLMMNDVSPGGQYALYDDNFALLEPSINVLAHYNQRPLSANDFPTSGPIYKDENGNQDYVVNDLGQTVKPEELSLSEFIQKFRPSWARTLVYWHPEYCYYRWCLFNAASRKFDIKIKEDLDADQAFAGGYMDYNNPTALLDKDPFFNTINGIAGKGSCYYNAMAWELNNYSKTKVFISHNPKNILEFIDFTLYCKDQDFNNSCSVSQECRKKNREWELYVAIYLDLKQKYDEMARRCWQPTCTNCYIGTDGISSNILPTECAAQPNEEWQSLLPDCSCTQTPLPGCPSINDIVATIDNGCPKFTINGGAVYAQDININYHVNCVGVDTSHTITITAGHNSATDCGTLPLQGCTVTIDQVACGSSSFNCADLANNFYISDVFGGCNSGVNDAVTVSCANVNLIPPGVSVSVTLYYGYYDSHGIFQVASSNQLSFTSGSNPDQVVFAQSSICTDNSTHGGIYVYILGTPECSSGGRISNNKANFKSTQPFLKTTKQSIVAKTLGTPKVLATKPIMKATWDKGLKKVVTENLLTGKKQILKGEKKGSTITQKPIAKLHIKPATVNGKQVQIAENSNIVLEPGKKYRLKDLMGNTTFKSSNVQSHVSARTQSSFCDTFDPNCIWVYPAPSPNIGCLVIEYDPSCTAGPLPPGASINMYYEYCSGDQSYVDGGYASLSSTNPSTVVCYNGTGPCSSQGINISNISCDGGSTPPTLPSTCLPSQCNDDPRHTAYQYKTRAYPEYLNPCTIAKMSCVDPGAASNTVENSVIAAIDGNCNAAADNLIQELKNRNCGNINSLSASTLIDFKNDLIAVCHDGGMATNPIGTNGIIQLTNPYGASTSPQGGSFDAIIQQYIGAVIPDGCSSDIVGMPYPYDKITYLLTKPLIRESSELICTQLHGLKSNCENNIGHTPSDQEFYDYLKGLLNDDFELTLSELVDLQNSCHSECPSKLLDHDILLPAALSKDGGCKGCAEIDRAIGDFKDKYPNVSNTDPQYELLFKNFMNHHFGFGLSYADYIEFIAGCESGTSRFGLLCDKAAVHDQPVEEYTCVKDKIDNAFSQALQAFWQYKDSVNNAFRIAYRTRCRYAKASVALQSPFQEYHYTLYYYDQAGNLVKTVPPQGVVPLIDAQVSEIKHTWEDPIPDNCLKLNQTEYISFQDNKYLKDAFTIEYRIKPLSLPSNQIRLWATYSNRQIHDATDYKENAQLFYKHSTHQFELRYATIALDGITYKESSILFNTSALVIDQWAHLSLNHGAPGMPNEFILYLNGKPYAGTVQSHTETAYPSSTLDLLADNFTILQDNIGTSQIQCRNLRIFTRNLPSFEVQVNADQSAQIYSTDALIHSLKLNDGSGTAAINDASANQGLLSAGALWVIDFPFTATKHNFVTSYAYNSLNQVVKQNTPDGGTSEFWYDRLGRLALSQNAEQKISSTGDANNRYSYTKYDALGRIMEVGERASGSDQPTEEGIRNDVTLANFIDNGSRRQITITRYNNTTDAPDNNAIIAPTFITDLQENMRNRVAATFFKAGDGDFEQQFASYYTYDISGNVKTLWQQLVPMRPYDGTGIKRIDYDYDLVSGKVNHVWYQKDKRDQYYYKYNYDADNRLVEAWSGRSDNASTQLRLDASYKYYLHGPLARTDLGHTTNRLQGIDYAYTLQGWLKGVNSTSLDASKDMGKDGNTTGMHQNYGRDVYSFGLNYYASDYNAIGESSLPNKTFLPYSFASKPEVVGRPLYNGNIAAISLSLYKINGGKTTGYSYGYDQLNRLANMRKHLDDISNGGSATSWNYATSSLPSGNDAYKETYSYDANGNILSLLRNGAGTATSPLEMDDMKYSYYYKKTDGNWGEYGPGLPAIADADVQYMTNRLYRVRDAVAATKYTTDIDDQAAVNYQYDNIGNMIGDAAEGVNSIRWTVYGKIQSVTKVKNGVTTNMNYYYDVTGNRVIKNVNGKNTFYIRDAQGNVLSVYEASDAPIFIPGGGGGRVEELHQNKANKTNVAARPLPPPPPVGYVWAEQHLYGSSRLGMYTPREYMLGVDDLPPTTADLQGKRTYELSNHLGNVHVTIADIKREVITGSTSYFVPEILTTSDYYPFGMLMPERHGYKIDGGWASGNDMVNGNTVPQQLTVNSRTNSTPPEYRASRQIELMEGFESGSVSDAFVAYIADGTNTAAGGTNGTGGEYNVYRYGFNGKENDNEVKGEGDEQDYGMRIYDTRLGRFLSVDPLTKSYPMLTPYQFASNTPIMAIDLDGLEGIIKSLDVKNFIDPPKVSIKIPYALPKSETSGTGNTVIEKSDFEKIISKYPRLENLTSKETKALNYIYEKELPSGKGKKFGDWEDIKTDAGGVTKFGIAFNKSWKSAAAFLKIEPTMENLKGLTVMQADNFYKNVRLKDLGVLDIQNEGLALVIASQSTLGQNRTLTLIRETLNESGFSFANDPTDPKPLAPEEIKAINSLDANKFGNKLLDKHDARYQKGQRANRKGWHNRVESDRKKLE